MDVKWEKETKFYFCLKLFIYSSSNGYVQLLQQFYYNIYLK